MQLSSVEAASVSLIVGNIRVISMLLIHISRWCSKREYGKRWSSHWIKNWIIMMGGLLWLQWCYCVYMRNNSAMRLHFQFKVRQTENTFNEHFSLQKSEKNSIFIALHFSKIINNKTPPLCFCLRYLKYCLCKRMHELIGFALFVCWWFYYFFSLINANQCVCLKCEFDCCSNLSANFFHFNGIANIPPQRKKVPLWDMEM